jgi:hypothetical protein
VRGRRRGAAPLSRSVGDRWMRSRLLDSRGLWSKAVSP